ncbi:DUF2911 domain-containing protein [Sphingobacterium alkalisoli]|uniref:DUF2911 domain-containing protein n=1 Tax=Sphingobacterium alkalisoli TaxID=1874115 RepID=A0A4U0H8N9_9SPHI|nr:DUF2911 domain-containing protein [Sphingobacterium alkalisoli]TJY68237.1 DUF2911 domain-containing protein [Sphingobacterium alkalisoli]GGH08000.1 hypothetical protein GCM10011418_05320 [Sphingobacterium alkalisoli]
MNRTLLSAFAASALFFTIQTAEAQVKLPPASSTQTITQGLGIKKISLAYQRPNINGRVVFGELVPYGEVWRTGANNIPAITFEEEVSIEGNKVPAGTYGLFTIPNQSNWTIILSKNVQQWGAYQYKQEEDLLRFNVKSQATSQKVETFTINFTDVTPNSTNVTLAWENTQVAFNIKVDQSTEILASLDQAMQGEKKPYFQAAQYYYTNGLDLKKATDWINEADKGNNEAPYIKYWKARILLKSGNKAGAAQAAKEGVAIAEKSNNGEYIKLNNQVLGEATK